MKDSLSLIKLADSRKMCMLTIMSKYSQCEDYVKNHKPRVELRASPKMKMKILLAKRRGFGKALTIFLKCVMGSVEPYFAKFEFL